MSFLFYERVVDRGSAILRPTGAHFKLSGYNLIFRAWEKRGKPVDQGWHVSADELIAIHTGGAHDRQTHRLLIDFHPASRERVGLIELLDIYAFTYGNGLEGQATWTPMMFKLRTIYYEEFDELISDDEKAQRLDNLREPSTGDDFIEFLYLTGPSWSWGRQGRCNAVFLHPPARDYFRPHF